MSSEQVRRQVGSSAVLVTFGVMVVLASLKTVHAQSTLALSPTVSPQTSSLEPSFSEAFDESYPGSWAYMSARAWEKLQLDLLSGEDRVVEQLNRVQERTSSGKLALRSSESELAYTTFLKAYGYLHQAVHDCRAEELCEDFSDRFSQRAEELAFALEMSRVSSEDGQQRARFEGLQAQLLALRTQFSF